MQYFHLYSLQKEIYRFNYDNINNNDEDNDNNNDMNNDNNDNCNDDKMIMIIIFL